MWKRIDKFLELYQERNTIMSTGAQALADLTASVTSLTTAVSGVTTEMSALLTLIGTPGVAPADVENAVAQLKTLVDALNAAVAAAQAATSGPKV